MEVKKLYLCEPGKYVAHIMKYGAFYDHERRCWSVFVDLYNQNIKYFNRFRI